jgi:hypothetical protein
LQTHLPQTNFSRGNPSHTAKGGLSAQLEAFSATWAVTIVTTSTVNPGKKKMSPSPASRRDFLAQTSGAMAVTALAGFSPAAEEVLPHDSFKPVTIPAWVFDVTRMAFLSPDEVAKAAKAGVQVVHTNLIWPYFPLRRDGGGLSIEEDRRLRKLVGECHRHDMKLVLGLPPFPPVALVKKHPDWRVHPSDSNAATTVEARENDLSTRVGCNLGPWGDYLIDVCAELIANYQIDGFSFDGNYHPPLCYCPACKAAYRRDRQRELPAKANLDDVDYRAYLVWRGERLEEHYGRLQRRIKQVHSDAVLMSWTVNAGRYGHLLTSPRAMPTRLNRLFDLAMQEWWLDESNLGASIAPAFGAAYLRAVTGGRPCASEPYLMSRGKPYGTDSFPAHERRTRCLLAVTNGNVLAESFGWAGHEVAADFREIARHERYLRRTESLPWSALLVSEQTRQFYAYKDIANRFLPHVFGAFRAVTEEHLPVVLINDWDLDAGQLARYAVVVLANAAALSDCQVAALCAYVHEGGGLVATGETSLCDELGRPRRDFALAELLGVAYRGRPRAPQEQPQLDDDYWRYRSGVATLRWTDHPLVRDARLGHLVPLKSVTFCGPQVLVSEPKQAGEVALRMTPEGWKKPPVPAAVLRSFGAGHVAYYPAAVDAALWSYAYPYQRRLLVGAIQWAARHPPPILVQAPLCVQVTYFTQADNRRRRIVLHFFNGVNTTAHHGLPAMDVPLREEVIPIHGIEVRFAKDVPRQFRLEPGAREVQVRRDGETTLVQLPPLEIHTMLVAEFD